MRKLETNLQLFQTTDFVVERLVFSGISIRRQLISERFGALPFIESRVQLGLLLSHSSGGSNAQFECLQLQLMSLICICNQWINERATLKRINIFPIAANSATMNVFHLSKFISDAWIRPDGHTTSDIANRMLLLFRRKKSTTTYYVSKRRVEMNNSSEFWSSEFGVRTHTCIMYLYMHWQCHNAPWMDLCIRVCFEIQLNCYTSDPSSNRCGCKIRKIHIDIIQPICNNRCILLRFRHGPAHFVPAASCRLSAHQNLSSSPRFHDAYRVSWRLASPRNTSMVLKMRMQRAISCFQFSANGNEMVAFSNRLLLKYNINVGIACTWFTWFNCKMVAPAADREDRVEDVVQNGINITI